MPTNTTLRHRHHRDSKVWRRLSHEFGVVRLYRTFSIYIVAGETRCAVCLSLSSGWFKHIEPLHYRDSKLWRVFIQEFGVVRLYRNFSINSVKGETRCVARCGEVYHMSSGWFDCTEPSLSLALQWKQGVQGAYALVRGGSSTSNLIEPTRTTTSQR